MNRKIKYLLLILLITLIPLSLGFTTTSNKLTSPQKVYRVYLKGKYIGLIESKSELDNARFTKEEIEKGFFAVQKEKNEKTKELEKKKKKK